MARPWSTAGSVLNKASNKQIYEPEWKAEGRLHRATRLAVKRPG